MQIAQQFIDIGAPLEPLIIDVAHLIEESQHLELEARIAERLAAQMVHIDGAANLSAGRRYRNGPGRVLATHLLASRTSYNCLLASA